MPIPLCRSLCRFALRDGLSLLKFPWLEIGPSILRNTANFSLTSPTTQESQQIHHGIAGSNLQLTHSLVIKVTGINVQLPEGTTKLRQQPIYNYLWIIEFKTEQALKILGFQG